MKYAHRATTTEELVEAERLRVILKQARRDKGLKQCDLAELIGVKQVTYSIIERDFKRASGYRQDQICDILGLERPVLFKE